MKFKEMCWVKVAQGHWEGTPMSSYAQNKMYLCMKLERIAFESGFCLFSVWIPGIQLRLSNLMANLFTCLTISSIPR